MRTARLFLLLLLLSSSSSSLLLLLVLLSLCSVYHAEGFGLLLAKGCDLIAAPTPCKQKHPLKLSAYINWTAVYAYQRCGREDRPGCVRRQFLAETRASKFKGKTGTKRNRCLIKFSYSVGHNRFSFDSGACLLTYSMVKSPS